MTAPAVWPGGPMPAGVVMSPATESTFLATRERAADIDARLRMQVGQLTAQTATVIDLLHEARTANVHLRCGFENWADYVVDVFHDLRNLPLGNRPEAIAERRAIVRSLLETPREDGKPRSISDIVNVSGWSRGVVQNDRAALGFSEKANADAEVIDLHPAPETPAFKYVWQEALWYLAREQEKGLTRLDLAAAAGWSEGKAGGVLFRLRRKRYAVNDGAHRVDYEVFTVTDAGRAALEEDA